MRSTREQVHAIAGRPSDSPPIGQGKARDGSGEYDRDANKMGMKAVSDSRFTVPLYTVAEAARFLGVPPSTMGTWAKGYVRRPAGRRR